MEHQWLNCVRAIQWSYPAELRREQAESEISRLAERGVSMILTEDHRYIMFDLPEGTQPHFLFMPQSRAKSIAATRLMAETCHRRGIKILHHATAAYCHEEFMRERCDWVQRDARRPDEPVFFEEYGGVWLFCLNHPEFREAFYRMVIEFTKETGVDGWMIDEVEWLPTWFSCGCRWCRDKFKMETGMTLPVDANSPVWENFEDPVWRAWLRFRMKSAADFFADLKKRLDDETPGKILTTCHAGASDTWSAQFWGTDAIEYSRVLNYIFYEAYVRNGIPFYGWLWYFAELKLYAAIARPTDVAPLALFYPRSELESRFSWALSSAAGFRFWACNNASASYPFDFFKWQASHEFLFDAREPMADAALLFSKQTRDGYKGRDLDFYVNEWRGWAQTLIEANIPFEAALERDLTKEYLSRFRLVIIPHAVCLSDAQIAALLDYASSGGRIITTGETGWRDETGEPRGDMSLAFALEKAGKHFSEKMGMRRFLPCARMDEEFCDRRDPEAGRLMLAAVRDALNGAPSFEINAPEGIFASGFRSKDGSLLIHMINCSGALPSAKGTIHTKNYSIQFPETKSIRVSLRAKSAGVFRNAEIYTPDADAPEMCEMINDGETQSVVIPILRDYAIVRLS